tara:strand:- start:1457 stop:3184 length:1728 start_codon:yes stop_codon:yes gene_type:complete
MLNSLKRWFGSSQRSINNPAVPLNSDTIVDYLGNQGANRSGINVNKNTVFNFSPVWQAVTMISGDLAKMKINLFEEVEEDGSNIRKKINNEVSSLVKKPNQDQNWNKFWRRFWVQSLLYNRGYIYVERSRNGDPLSLYVLMSDQTSWNQKEGIYTTNLLGESKTVGLFPSQVIEVEGIQLESENKCELLDKFKESIGLGLAAQGHNAKFFGNGGQMGGILMIPPQVSKEGSEKLEQGWRRKYENENAWFKTAILRDGVRYQQTGVDPEKSQLSQVREDQVYEVARWFNLSPSRLGLSGASSYNSKHEDNQNYLDQTLSPWMSGLTSELSFKLLAADEQIKQYFSFDTSQLLALNPKLRAETNKIRIDMGEISPNEARIENGLPPREGGDGYRLPSGVLIESNQPEVVEEIPVEEVVEEVPVEEVPVEEAVEEASETSLPDEGPVSAQALNGAQIGGLLEVLEVVSLGGLTLDSAVQLVLIAFPSIDKEQATNLVKGAKKKDGAVEEDAGSLQQNSVEERALHKIKTETDKHISKLENVIRERAKKKSAEDFDIWFKEKFKSGTSIEFNFEDEENG